jgi:hypothetical protein
MSKQVASKRMLEKYEIEFNGRVFNCLECNKDNCCSTSNNNSANRIACQKCRCQQLYTVRDGTRAGSEPVGDLGCIGCTNNMSEAECSLYEFLNNKVIQSMSIVDCSNRVIVSGANNQISDVSLRSICNMGDSPTQVNSMVNNLDYNSPIQLGPITTNQTTLSISAGVLVTILLLMILFR